MDHGVEDDEMAAAIAASLATYEQEGARHKPVEIGDSDSEDDEGEETFQADLKRALEESKRETELVANATAGSSKTTEEASTTSKQDENPAISFLRQRAQLEKERLERSKGIVNVNVNQTSTASKKRSYSASQSEDDDSSNGPPPKRASTTSNAAKPNETAELFYQGELRQTANRITERDDIAKGVKTFRISEIIGDKNSVAFAILSSYSTDIAWLYGMFSPMTPVILVNQPTETGNSDVKGILPNWIMTMPFLRGGRGAMHVKLMLLFYRSGRLRLVLPTANFIDYDWRDIENTAWVQDFPPLSKPAVGREATSSAFASTLQMVLTKLNVSPALASLLTDHPNLPIKFIGDLGKGWNFTKAAVKLIPSMSGKYEGWDQVLKQGHVSLMKGIMDIGAHRGHTKRDKKKPPEELIVECQGSSIGTYSAQWLQEFYSSCCGISPETWLDKSKASRSKLPKPPLRILFPSLKTVQSSVLGEDGGGTMFCRTSQWEGANFPRDLFYDSNSKRGKVLMHTKMILGLWRDSSSDERSSTTLRKYAKQKEVLEIDSDDEVEIIDPFAAGWLYVGSHNFTPSAWGTLSGSAFTPVLNITNYELGILIPLPEDIEEAEKRGNHLVSWQRPPRKYDIQGGDIPWCQN
ncbi:hypothetical protein PIIN_06638 [Serendipita indica DSM 11827]|uniref:Phospholipase D/nuclease n=1 Tax=Serendipita indica (strain DSM 11827) TaxID=1109443 RepID=G4TN08_SERID|nr:hypothetical protein PIIN_06638 [Serendipita indica DSM 11827]